MPIEVAITIDDFPFSGESTPEVAPFHILEEMIFVFQKHHITSVFGFMNGKAVQYKGEYLHLLRDWVNQGHYLGNHTFSHLDLNKVTSKEYIDDIQKNEILLEELMGKKDYKYFRYPYLREGNTQEKRDAVREFLFASLYRIAPVTILPEEYRWNETYIQLLKKNDEAAVENLKNKIAQYAVDMVNLSRSLAALLYQRDIKHILLMHSQVFSVYVLDAILTAYKNNNVKFISLQEALTDEIYQENTWQLEGNSLSFLSQLCRQKKINYPTPPSPSTDPGDYSNQ